jgi:hypothetical protein
MPYSNGVAASHLYRVYNEQTRAEILLILHEAFGGLEFPNAKRLLLPLSRTTA